MRPLQTVVSQYCRLSGGTPKAFEVRLLSLIEGGTRDCSSPLGFSPRYTADKFPEEFSYGRD